MKLPAKEEQRELTDELAKEYHLLLSELEETYTVFLGKVGDLKLTLQCLLRLQRSRDS